MSVKLVFWVKVRLRVKTPLLAIAPPKLHVTHCFYSYSVVNWTSVISSNVLQLTLSHKMVISMLQIYITACYPRLITRVKIGGGGLDPHWKTQPPLQTPGKKARGSGFDPPLGLIPTNAFIMISLVFHY